MRSATELIKNMLYTKKKSDDKTEVFHSKDINGLDIAEELPPLFSKDMLNLLRKENPLEQEYFYIKRGQSYAFFILYHNRMNLFTFGKASLYYPVNVIGYPCSLSIPGYVTNNEELLFEFLRNIKGARLMLNLSDNAAHKGWITGETLPTCILSLMHNGKPYESVCGYMNRLRSSYRRRINQSLKACGDIAVETDGDPAQLYRLYLNTYNRSDYKLERLEEGFFNEADGERLVFKRDKKPVGFALLRGHGKRLDFMFCGMDYNEDTAQLYFFMLYNIVRYGIEKGYEEIDLGQTSEAAKMRFGAYAEKRYFYASHSSPFMRLLLKIGKGLLEYHYDFPDYRAFKEDME